MGAGLTWAMSPTASLSLKRKLIAIAVFLALVVGAIGTEENPGVLAHSKQQNELQAHRHAMTARYGNTSSASPWSKDTAHPNPQPTDFRPPNLVPLN
ncbi:MAG: hypothetical protein ABGW87_08840 [Sphingomonadaceae bacterium]